MPGDPLLVVLSELARLRPWLVLMRGRDYWRVENALANTRRDLARAPEPVRAAMRAPDYRWEDDEDGFAVIRRRVPGGEEVFAAEAGSRYVPPGI